MPPSLDALTNAARLRNSPGQSNMANYADIFAGPAAGHVPSAHEQFTGDLNADNAATELGAGPAISALRHAFDNQRLQQVDSQLGEEADLSSGRPQHIATMQHTAGNALADMDSEAAAGRHFLPFQSQLDERDTADALQTAQARYVLPAQLKAQGDANAATITAKGRVDAAGARDHSLPMRGLMDALTAIINKTGHAPDDQTLATLRTQFGVK